VKKFSATTPIYYRSDIQALRGFAILIVVIYHMGFAFPGGFIGVDIFFVISGFVITQLLVREGKTRDADLLKEFYSQRVRRLLPALAVLITSTMVLSIFFMSPLGEQQEIAQTARASSLFSTNVYFFFQSNYWALTENPFRHLWSLAVEEQFYLIFPFFIVFLRRLGCPIKSKKALWILISIAVLSFAGSYLLSSGYRITQLPTRFAFFGTPWRLWELLAGSVTAITLSLVRRVYIPKTISVIGLLMVIWPVFTLNSFTPFPGSAAVAPVFGTSFLLFAGSKTLNDPLIRFLKPFEKLGDVSYSWYLWHWPLIVFLKKIYPDSSFTAPLAAAATSLVIAQFSTRFFETPIRTNRSLNGGRALILGLTCASVPFSLSFGLDVLADSGLGLKVAEISVNGENSLATKLGCTDEGQQMVIGKSCKLTRSTNKDLVLLVGDSAAGAISDGVYLASKKADLDFIVVYANSCPYQNKPNLSRIGCAEFVDFREKLIEDLRPEVLVVANMSDLYVSANPQNGVPGNTNSAGREPRNYTEALSFWIENLEEKLLRDLKAQKTLVILQPPISKFASPTLLRREPDQDQTSRSLSEFRDRIVQEEIKLFTRFSNITIFDPAKILCERNLCTQFIDGSSLYYNSRHLTVDGSKILSSEIFNSLISVLEE
jgi:peptidoglycan/LPS O-acetylase OafA/YrhL